MSKPALRILLTILMYSGAVIFLLPYLSGQIASGILFLVVGLVLAVVCGPPPLLPHRRRMLRQNLPQAHTLTRTR